MDKIYLKTQIAMRQAEFPTQLIARDNPLPLNEKRIVTIPGVRRCGKTSKMEMAVNSLLADGVDQNRILWVSFDDERLYSMKAEDLNLIIEAYTEMYPEIPMAEVYMFFDEIQLIEGWEFFVMRLFKHYTKNIFISGSNASMLSSEMNSALRGWPDEQETYPLSFNEFCRFRGVPTDSYKESDLAKLKNAFFDYNVSGGFPEAVLTDSLPKRTKLLQGYFDTMLLRDLAEHYDISNTEALRFFLKRLMVNLTKPTSIRSIHNDIKSQGLKISKDVLYQWGAWVCDIFMFVRIPNYSRSLSKTEGSLPKYYCIDNGLRDAVILPHSDDLGKKLENTVFLHLYRNRSPLDRIFYYQGRGECDFAVQRGTEITELIQVTWNMDDDATRRREIDGLREACNEIGCRNLTIVTADTTETVLTSDGLTIKVIPAWRYLLGL